MIHNKMNEQSESKMLGIPKRDVIAHDAHFGVSTRHTKGSSEDLSK